MKYAFDSDTISYLLNKDSRAQYNFKNAVDNGDEYVIPPMVYYEVKRWLVIKNATAKLSAFIKLCRFTNQIVMSDACWEKAIEIYTLLTKKGSAIDDGDIFIAAYCLVNDYTLVTNNTSHFQRIDGLKIVNWKT